MYQFLTQLGRSDLALRQAPAFTMSFVVASLFYRFGSFALEVLAFMATWYVVDAGIEIATKTKAVLRPSAVGLRRQKR